MDKIKKSHLFRAISVVLILTFISLDISYAYPPEHNPSNSTLATPSVLQQMPINENAARFQQSVFSQGALIASVYDIGEYFFGNAGKSIGSLPSKYAEDALRADLSKHLIDAGTEILNIVPVEYLKETSPDKLKSALEEIGFKGTLPDEGVVFILYRQAGKKFLVQIARKGEVRPENLPGYEWVISDKYVVKYMPEDYESPKGEVIHSSTAVKEKPKPVISEPIAEVSAPVPTGKNIENKPFSIRAILSSLSGKLYSINLFAVGFGAVGLASAFSALKDLAFAHPVITGIAVLCIGIAIFFAYWRMHNPVSWYLSSINSPNIHVRAAAARGLLRINDPRIAFMKEYLSVVASKPENHYAPLTTKEIDYISECLKAEMTIKALFVPYELLENDIKAVTEVKVPARLIIKMDVSAAAIQSSVKVCFIGVGSPKHYNIWNNLSLETLVGDLKGHFGDEVSTDILWTNESEGVKSMVDTVLSGAPDIVGVSIQPGSMEVVSILVDALNSRQEIKDGKTMVVFGNQLPTYVPEKFIEMCPQGIVARGEGEISLRGLVRVARGELKLSDVPSIVYRDKDSGQIIHTQILPPKLNSLAYPPTTDTYEEIVKRGGNVQVQASRGCPWGGCAYCTRASFRNGGLVAGKGRMACWEGFTVERVLKTLDDVMSRGITEVEFSDDEFIGGRSEINIKRVFAIAEGIERLSEKHRMKFSFRIFTRPSVIYREKDADDKNAVMRQLLLALKKAGLVRVFIGIEAGNKSQLKRYTRGMTLGEVTKSIATLKELGLGVDAGFIMFDPELTIEEMLENINYFRANGLIEYNQWPFRPMVVNHGSRMVERLRDNGLLGAENVNFMAYGYRFKNQLVEKVAKIVDDVSVKTRTIFYAIKVKSKKYFDSEKKDRETGFCQKYVEDNGLIYLDLMEELGNAMLKGASEENIEAIARRADQRAIELAKKASDDVVRGDIGDADGYLRKEFAKIGIKNKVLGLLFSPARDFIQGKPLDPNIIVTKRTPETAAEFLRKAREQGVELSITGHLRGFDGAGSSLDLPEFQRALTAIGAKDLKDMPSTPTIASEFAVKVKFELADDSDVVEYVAPDYGITKDNPYKVKGKVQLTSSGRTPNGQKDGPAFIFNNVFGLKGVRITCESISPMALAGGMESSNVFNVTLIAAASMLSGADLSMAEIFDLAVKLENDEFGGLTGGQGHLCSMLGGAYKHVWLSGVKNDAGQFVNPYAAFSMPLLDENGLIAMERHMMIGQAGKEYVNGKAELGRTAALVNFMWTDLLRDKDEVGFPLHQEKLGLADRYVRALKDGNFAVVVDIMNRYVDIRDQLCKRWTALMLDAHDGKVVPEYAKAYADKVFNPSNPAYRDYAVLRQMYAKDGDGLRNISLYSAGPISDIVQAGRREGMTIMPLGAGGPGANIIGISPKGAEHIRRFFESRGLHELTEDGVRAIVRGTGTLIGHMPFKVGREPVKFEGFKEIGLKVPLSPEPAEYDQWTGKISGASFVTTEQGIKKITNIDVSEIQSYVVAELARRKEMPPLELFMFVHYIVPDTMQSLRSALDELVPLAMQEKLEASAITAAIDAAQAKYSLSDEETKILWLALTGPGQGGGSTTPMFEPLEPRQLLSSTETVSNLLPQYVSAPAAIVVNVINTYTDAISGDTININSSTKMATITNNEGRVIHFNGIIIIDPSIITTRSQTYPRVASYVDQAGRKWNVYGNLLDLVNGKDAVYGATINIDTKRNGTLVFPGQVQETFKTIIVRDPASTSKLPSSPYITSINIGGTAFKLYGTFYSFMNAGYSASRNTTSITISNRVDILDKVTIAASPKGSLVGEINMTSDKLYYVLNNKGTISVWSFDLKSGSLLRSVKPVMLTITPGLQILGVHFPTPGQAMADVAVENGSAVRVNLIDAEKPAPNTPSMVSVQPGDSRLYVQDRLADGTLGAPYAYTAQGVNWSPASIGTIPAKLTAEFMKWYQTDIPLMARMGINTVRVYHDFGTGPDAFKILNMFYSYGIKVIMEVDSPRHGVVADMGNISAVVNAYMDNPAILMWSIGNEWDTNNYYGHFSTIYDSARFTQDAALLIKSIDVNHPVMTVTNDPHYPGVHPLSPEAFPFETGRPYMSEIVNDLVPAVDVWALNIYRGSTLGDLFEQWRSISDKPMLIGEFGADSYDHRVRAENQAMQAGMNTSIWDEAYFNMSATRISGVSVGALSFEWNDEWWKAGISSRHNSSLSFSYSQPDLFNDEEWFGLVDINRKPKAAFYEMRDRFKNGVNAVELDASPTVRVVSQGLSGAEFDINDKVFYTRSGGQYGGRGINIAVLDKYTGIRMEDVRAFDTWLPFGGPHQGHQELIDYINSLPDGSIISLAVEDEAGLVSPSGTPWFDTENLYRTLEGLGSTMIRNVQYQGGWAMIAIKGQGVLAENYSSPGAPVYIQAELSLSLDPNHDLRPAQINAISSAVTQELAAREDISFTELFALVRSSVPDTMVNLRNALEDVKPLSEQINVDSKTISAAIEAAQIKYSLSDEETKILWLALLGPGQGGGEQQVPEAAARATEKLFELVENAHKYDGATATVTQAEAHSIIGSIIVLARNAKREEKKLFIGLETEWIPGIDEETGYGSQRDAINILLTEIKSIGDTLRSLGLDNVEVVEGNSQGLAGTLLKKAGSNLSNVVVLASAGTVNSASFAELRSTPQEKRAFLAGVDPSEIMEHYKDHKKDMQLAGQQLEIRIMEMLSIALELAVGKMPPKIPMIFSYDETLRIVIFMPKPEIFDYETLKDANKGRARALQAA